MADTLVLRLDIETGMYANFPENFKPYTDVKAVVGIGDFEPETDETDLRPVFRTHEGVVATGSGGGIIDDYKLYPLDTGMFVDNITPIANIPTAVDRLFVGRQGKLCNKEIATFVGKEAISAALDAIISHPNYDANLTGQLAILAVNYAQRDVQDTVTTSRF